MSTNTHCQNCIWVEGQLYKKCRECYNFPPAGGPADSKVLRAAFFEELRKQCGTVFYIPKEQKELYRKFFDAGFKIGKGT